MSQITTMNLDAAKVDAIAEVKADTTQTRCIADSVKDAGRVHIGGAMLRFSVKDSGRVHIGGAMLRF